MTNYFNLYLVLGYHLHLHQININKIKKRKQEKLHQQEN